MKFPLWATPQRRVTLVELFTQSQGFCVLRHGQSCPHLLEHCYEVASEDLIATWKAEDRQERERLWRRERRRMHAAPQMHKRGPFDTIRREEHLAKRPTFEIVGIGIGAFTFKRVAEVRIPGLRLTLWVDLQGLEGVSNNKLRKLARFKRGALPKKLVSQVEQRVQAQVSKLI